MAPLAAKTVQPAVEQPTPSTGRRVSTGIGVGLGIGMAIARNIMRNLRGEKVKAAIQPIDLNNLLEPYFDTGLYLAVNTNQTAVVATGKTIREAVDQAAQEGCSEPVIMRAPSREAMENSLHL